jgi:hypothetical protein
MVFLHTKTHFIKNVLAIQFSETDPDEELSLSRRSRRQGRRGMLLIRAPISVVNSDRGFFHPTRATLRNRLIFRWIRRDDLVDRLPSSACKPRVKG